MNKDWCYFDYAATTPMHPKVLEAYYKNLKDNYPNISGLYSYADQARSIANHAVEGFADLIHADPREIYFTSGATESNNLALFGSVQYHGVKQPRLITLQSEHKAILDPLAKLATAGVSIEILPVQSNGLIDLNRLQAALQSPTTLVSIMAANNETGVIQPIKTIAKMVHEAGAKLHVDAAQALGKLSIDVQDLDVDMMSFSGHKIYGPKGIGALYMRRIPKMRIQPQILGGGQQKGMRAGTMPVALMKAFFDAAEIAMDNLSLNYQRVRDLSKHLLTNLPPAVKLNTPLDFDHYLPHILSLDVGVNAMNVVRLASESRVAIAAGSACQSANTEGSHVLQSMGLERQAKESIRVSISHLTTEKEINQLIKFINEELHDLSN